jgi:hypothetical protein
LGLIALIVGGIAWGTGQRVWRLRPTVVAKPGEKNMTDNNDDPGYWRLVDPYFQKVSIYDGPEVFLQDFQQIPLEAGHLLAVHWCQSEVCNGGFHQFFSNSTGVLAPEACAGFRAIGLPDLAEVVQKAMDFFPQPFPRERDTRNDLLDRYSHQHPDEWNAFEKLNQRFYELLDAGDGHYHGRFESAADRFAREHSDG